MTTMVSPRVRASSWSGDGTVMPSFGASLSPSACPAHLTTSGQSGPVGWHFGFVDDGAARARCCCPPRDLRRYSHSRSRPSARSAMSACHFLPDCGGSLQPEAAMLLNTRWGHVGCIEQTWPTGRRWGGAQWMSFLHGNHLSSSAV